MYYPFLVMTLSAAVLLSGCATQRAAPVASPTVTLSAPAAAAAVNRLKHKIAIVRLALPIGTAPVSESLVTATAQAKSHLENHVRQSGKFMVIEHGLLQLPLENENLKVVNDETVGADYLVTGTLLRHDLVMPGFLDGWRDTPAAYANSSLHIDIVDGHTGTTIFSRQFEGNASLATSKTAPFGLEQQKGLQSQALTRALNNAATEITTTLLQRRWRGQILSTQQGFILVNGGAGQGIQVGDRFHVLPLAHTAIETAPAPATSPFLATLKVVAQAGENENELSVCELVEGKLPETLADLSVLDAP